MACVVDVDAEAAMIIEPTNYTNAVNDPDYGVKWDAATKGEVTALKKNTVFLLNYKVFQQA